MKYIAFLLILFQFAFASPWKMATKKDAIRLLNHINNKMEHIKNYSVTITQNLYMSESDIEPCQVITGTYSYKEGLIRSNKNGIITIQNNGIGLIIDTSQKLIIVTSVTTPFKKKSIDYMLINNCERFEQELDDLHNITGLRIYYNEFMAWKSSQLKINENGYLSSMTTQFAQQFNAENKSVLSPAKIELKYSNYTFNANRNDDFRLEQFAIISKDKIIPSQAFSSFKVKDLRIVK